MDIFVTGASGYIGSALTRTLIARGHRVRGLARSAAAEAVVLGHGAEPVRAALTDVDVLARAAADVDAVVHMAATDTADRADVDRAAVTAMLDAGPGAFITTTGAPRARSSRTPVAEDDTAPVEGPLAWLAEAEARVLDSGSRGAVVRPPMVYGDGGGPVSRLVAQAASDGVARYIGDGGNRWSTVHVRDLALAYALLLETGATGVFHVSDGHESMADLMAAVGAKAGVPVASWPLDEALATQGWGAGFLAADAVLDASRITALGWTPAVGLGIPRDLLSTS
ncbi:NAD-dependent epimerase/dehydratase family protein [Actinokineospora cianjurensis]|uniref:Nucleoside-diphosphate-sugar epimerase n=1 Tax=Actinokineospora cianjurensis TaxID=585224 RepID=A0A421B7K1_9PSEU|nr:NAD-dependent epimerase/dehydratase family protein [Actinokineospora cianjurensis]RLK60255.1 nucleoside-diphosphate-sugar epimerase [Actinokineospora cianjurensis]